MCIYRESHQFHSYIRRNKNVPKNPVYKSQRNRKQHNCPSQEEWICTLYFIHIGILYSSEKRTSLGNIMFSNKAVYRKYIQNDSIYIKFQNMLNDTILFRNPSKCGKIIQGRKVMRNTEFC